MTRVKKKKELRETSLGQKFPFLEKKFAFSLGKEVFSPLVEKKLLFQRGKTQC